MKQTELAAAIGVRPHTVWRYEAGENQPNDGKLDAIAEALGVPHRWLLRGGVVPPGLPIDEEGQITRPAPVLDPPITQEQQIAVLDEIDASPAIRACWGLHRQGTGAFQRITRAYMTHFIEVAQQELDHHVSIEAAAERAGEYAFNSAVEAHRATAPTGAKKKRSKT
jgi:Predicted transcriptional regulators